MTKQEPLRAPAKSTGDFRPLHSPNDGSVLAQVEYASSFAQSARSTLVPGRRGGGRSRGRASRVTRAVPRREVRARASLPRLRPRHPRRRSVQLPMQVWRQGVPRLVGGSAPNGNVAQVTLLTCSMIKRSYVIARLAATTRAGHSLMISLGRRRCAGWGRRRASARSGTRS